MAHIALTCRHLLAAIREAQKSSPEVVAALDVELRLNLQLLTAHRLRLTELL